MRPEDPGNEVASEHARVFEHAHEQWREITFIFPVISSFPVVPEVVPKARDTKYCKFFVKLCFKITQLFTRYKFFLQRIACGRGDDVILYYQVFFYFV